MAIGFTEIYNIIRNTKTGNFYNRNFGNTTATITAGCIYYTEAIAEKTAAQLGADFEVKKIKCDFSPNGMECIVLEDEQ